MAEPIDSDRLGQYPHPREARRLHGHAQAEVTLLKALQGRMPHAWIFGGQKGIGKATLAYRLAKALLASPGRTPATLETDPDASAIRRILAGAHPDLLTLRRPWDHKSGKVKGDLTVDEVRRLADFFARHAAEGGHRIAVVDAADDMNRNAANALLKILEEPPPHGLLILIAHAPRALLPTIRSRCRMLTMNPLQDADVARVLDNVAPDLPDRQALVAMSGGSPGAALTMADHDGPGLDRTLTQIRALRGRDANAMHMLANELAPASAEPRYTMLINRLKAAFAAEAASGDRQALDAWQMATDLARAEEGLNIDRRAVVLRLLDRYASMGSA